jgi:uncharacterized membrane protein HdeD (DUF308 family)
MSLDPAGDRPALPPKIWWLFIVVGVVWMILGLLAIGEPYVATDIAVIFFGVLLVVGGGLQSVQALATMRRHGFLLRLLEGLLSLAVGILLLVDPVQGEIGLTLLIAVFLTIGGFMRIFLAFQLRRLGSWFWLLLSGIIEVLLGLLIWTGWPGTSAWVIGLFIGIRMLFQGSSMLALGLTLRGVRGSRV